MSIETAIEKAAKELPEGYSLTIYIENGSAYVESHDDLGFLWWFEATDRTLEEQILEGNRQARYKINGSKNGQDV